MGSAKKPKPWLGVYALPVGILAVLAVLYWFQYMPSRKNDLTSRYFRSLADTGDRIRSELLALSGPMTNILKNTNQTIRNVEILYINTQPRTTTNIPHPEPGAGLSSEVNGREIILTCSGKDGEVKGRCLLKELADPITGRTEFFDVLILDSEQNVLYQRGSDEVRFQRLTFGEAAGAGTFQTNWVSQAGLKYILFTQPFSYPFPSAKGTKGWAICGIVKPGEILKQTMALPALAIVLVVGAALLLALSWPILDMYYSPCGRDLRWRNVLLLHACTALGCALLTLLLLTCIAYHSLRHNLNSSVERLATNILGNFRAEAEAIHRQLSTIDRTDKKSEASETLIFSRAFPDSLQKAAYPFFSIAFWADANGNQTTKWTPRERNTSWINVGKRAYFSNVVEKRLWSLNSKATEGGFFLEPIYSWNTAENLAIWSIPSSKPSNEIAAMDVKLLSLLNPVLPADFGFCVVDQAGQVLFHSDEHRNLRENFFKECRAGATVRTAVYGRTQGRFDCYYLGQRHRLFITPVPDFPWSLITFRNKQYVQPITIEVPWMGWGLYMAAFLVSVAGLLVLALFIGRRWLYPDERQANRYAGLAAINGICGILLLILAAFSNETTSWLVVAVVLPMAGLTLAGWLLQKKHGSLMDRLLERLNNYARHALSRKAKSSTPPGVSLWRRYHMALASLVFVTAIVPAALLQRVFFQNEVELIAKRAQFTVLQQMAAREQRLTAEANGFNNPEGWAQRRTDEKWDLYYGSLFDTEIVTNAPHTSEAHRETGGSSLLHEFISSIRLRNATTRQGLSYLSRGAFDGKWSWRKDQDGRLCLRSESFNQANGGRSSGVEIASVVPSPGSEAGWPVAGFIAMIAGCVMVAWLLARRITRDVFVFKKPGPCSYEIHDVQPASAVGLYVVFESSKISGELAARWPTVSWQDKCESAPAMGSGSSPPTNSTGVIVKDFGERPEDPAATEKKLECIVALLADGDRAVLLVTKVHPLNFALNGENGNAEAVASKRSRWVQLFRHCKYTYGKELPGGGGSEREFSRVWAACSPAERKLLYHVATSNLADPRAPELCVLQERHLIGMDPLPEVAHPGFREWVADNYRKESATALAHLQNEDSTWWSKNKGRLFWVVVAVAFFFFVTQRSVLDSTVTVMAGFATALATLMNAVRAVFEARGKIKPPS